MSKKSSMTQCKYMKHDGITCCEKALPDSEIGFCIFHEKIENKDINKCMELFYKRIKSGETDFEGYVLKDLDLINEKINKIGKKNNKINFVNSKFSGKANFIRIKFSESADFRGASFLEDADFRNTIFSRGVLFKNAKFSGNALFKNATFLMVLNF